MSDNCPFCDIALEDNSPNPVTFFRDAYPVSRGHTLVVPKAHRESIFTLQEHVKAELWHTVEYVKHLLDLEFNPDGYNIGFNAGAAAGQTVEHLHVHVIPRYIGDVENPAGGIRGVIPSKKDYK